MSKRYRRKKNKEGGLLFALISTLSLAIVTIGEFIFYVIPALIYRIWGIWGYYKSLYYLNTHKSVLKMAFDKGARGEYMIYRHLKKMGGEQRWLFNTYLPRENGRTTEVDAILLHASGVYVFESKNYSGWIFGTETHTVWTQCLKPSENAGTRKYHFPNPIMQNKLHLKYLFKAIPELTNMPVYSVIVFGNKCKLRKITLSGGKHAVISRKKISKAVAKMTSVAANAISEETLQSIYDRLYPMTQVGEDVKAQHILDIQNQIQAEQENDDTIYDETGHASPTVTTVEQLPQVKYCPQCDRKLVLRTARNGASAGQQFWGCSGFPHCRYIGK